MLVPITHHVITQEARTCFVKPRVLNQMFAVIAQISTWGSNPRAK